jgi:hypothetical protein
MQLVLDDDRCAEGVGVKRNMPPLWAATVDIVLRAGRLSTILVRTILVRTLSALSITGYYLLAITGGQEPGVRRRAAKRLPSSRSLPVVREAGAGSRFQLHGRFCISIVDD